MANHRLRVEADSRATAEPDRERAGKHNADAGCAHASTPERLCEHTRIEFRRCEPYGVIETIRGTAALAFLLLNTVLWCLPIYGLGALRPLTPGRAKVVLGDAMLRALNAWVGCAKRALDALRVARIDHDFPTDAPFGRRDGWFLVVSNHQSWADILVLVFALYGQLPPFKFFTKRQLIWVPLLGLALWLLDYPLVRRYGRTRLAENPELAARDRQATRKACAGFSERPTSVLIFLEGTRFTPAKREAQRSPFRHLLRPKTGGFGMVIDELGGRLDAVVDITITYPGTPPGFWDFLCGRSPVVGVRARTKQPPDADQDAVRAWIDDLWREKDELLARPR